MPSYDPAAQPRGLALGSGDGVASAAYDPAAQPRRLALGSGDEVASAAYPAAVRGPAFPALVILTLLWTFALVTLGAVVRVTGSGLGCPDWPTCHGSLVPPLEPTALIEYSHRLAAALTTVLVGLVTAVAWTRQRSRGDVVALATAAAGLLILQVGLGAVSVRLELAEEIVTAHLAVAELLLGAMTLLAVRVTIPARFGRPRVLYVVAAAGTFVLVLTGAHVRGSGASLACLAWPLCDPLLPEGGPLQLHIAHRYVALLLGAVVAWAVVAAWRQRLRGLALAAGALFATQVLVGASYLWTQGSAVAQAAHLAGATAVWCALVALVGASAARAAPAAAPLASAIRDFIALTKPGVLSLLLVTALGGMFLAAGGPPPAGLALAVLVGGALGAGGANALNHYFERDVDELMSRTRARPLPRQRISAEDAFAFGIGLNVAGFVVLALFANLLAALLTLAASLFYVVVYTLWLKRTSAQNIVIGGAAGAVPPLVGWAAVQNDLALPALYLFAIVFFWTPAHFWALALLLRDDYARAGIPMLPVVYGERAAGWGILLYALLTVALTLLLFTTGVVGLLYLVAAVGLGVVFAAFAVQYLRDGRRATARRIYLYSMLYLALLFVAMMLDTSVRL